MSAALVAALALAATPVEIPGRYFDPPRVTVAPGATVVWRSHDGEPHTVVAAGGAFASGILARHEEFAQRFDAPGSFPYVCSLHPFMRGTVEVEVAAAPPPAAARLALTFSHGRFVARVTPARPGATLALERHFRDRYAWRQVAHRRLGSSGVVRFRAGNTRRRARVVLMEDGTALATSRVLRPWLSQKPHRGGPHAK
jgi:plastocyanin